ncbi:MAG: hypothetical protein B7W98_03230 [Parcubacteria group bacterium 20-58-5]|nr:MAG: hypothetical protein B7W98_03230 [Parcubacteria group bacterium 20-58-5]
MPDALLKTQLANILFAALFFFLVPGFGITPKTILALYLVVSLLLIFLWRLAVYPRLSVRRSREQAILLARGAEADELFAEVNGNTRYDVQFCSRKLGDAAAVLVVADGADIDTESLDKLSLEGKQVVAFEDLYEEVFDRVPLSRLDRAWFRKNVSKEDSLGYALAKRAFDIVGGLAMVVVTMLVAPFVYVANRFEGPGALFIKQERFGRYGAKIIVYKFRSMQKNLAASDEWIPEGVNRITKVGAFLRHTSLDEFPQGINIIRGELSLIGPRTDILGLGQRLTESLPYYKERYAVLPGITGWAQINQQYEAGHVSPQSVEETQVRLAYDFYYLKHRSLGLDIVIALKTVKRMFFRVSSW